MVMFISVMVTFNQSSYGVIEYDGTITIMMIFSQPSSVEFQVTINVSDITAIGTCYYINR